MDLGGLRNIRKNKQVNDGALLHFHDDFRECTFLVSLCWCSGDWPARLLVKKSRLVESITKSSSLTIPSSNPLCRHLLRSPKLIFQTDTSATIFWLTRTLKAIRSKWMSAWHLNSQQLGGSTGWFVQEHHLSVSVGPAVQPQEPQNCCLRKIQSKPSETMRKPIVFESQNWVQTRLF